MPSDTVSLIKAGFARWARCVMAHPNICHTNKGLSKATQSHLFCKSMQQFNSPNLLPYHFGSILHFLADYIIATTQVSRFVG